jgi:uncharacterized protein (DUF2062 family)
MMPQKGEQSVEQVWQGYLRPLVVSWARRFREHALDKDYLCRGVALGLLMAFLAPPGTQMVFAALLAPFFYANPVAAVLLVWVTNPLTMPFIYGSALVLGGSLLGMDTLHLLRESHHNWWSLLTDYTLHLKVTMAIGLGLALMGTASALLGYWLTWLLGDQFIAAVRHFSHEAHLPRRGKAHPKDQA